MSNRMRLTVGSCVYMLGRRATVTELSGRQAVLKDDLNNHFTASVVDVVQAISATKTVVSPQPERELCNDTELAIRLEHVREVETGYRSGTPLVAAPNEPQPAYTPSIPLKQRYVSKAAELNLDPRTVQGWVTRYRKSGAGALLDGRKSRTFQMFVGIDERWLDTARQIIDEHTGESTPTKQLVLDRIRGRLDRDHGEGEVEAPKKSRAYKVLSELAAGKNAFKGSAKAKRSIANRPDSTFSGLKATRPLQFLLFDTTRLDVFCMDPITMKWVPVELTVAMDLYSRCIVGMRLTPVSTKALDIARVLRDILNPAGVPGDWPETARWPYGGIPGACVFNPDDVTTTPGMCLDTVVIDHGKQYVSEHFVSACERLGISIQPARPYTPTDKAVVERFFRSIRQSLLEALPGYKGPDVYNRGDRPEDDAFFFIDEMDEVIREWIACVYHNRPHSSLVDPHAPGMNLSPAQMFDHGVARAGFFDIPADPHIDKQLLRIEWRNVHHYGIEIDTFRYSGEIVHQLHNTSSPYKGSHPGEWPFYVDDDDRSRVWFYHQPDNVWHELKWVHADALDAPFSTEAVAFVRSLAKTSGSQVDHRVELARLLDRWNVGLAASPKDRRLALRHLATRNSTSALSTSQHSQTYVEKVTRLMGEEMRPTNHPEEVLTEDSWPTASCDYYDEAYGDNW
jgi:transposase InsO family protein